MADKAFDSTFIRRREEALDEVFGAKGSMRCVEGVASPSASQGKVFALCEQLDIIE